MNAGMNRRRFVGALGGGAIVSAVSAATLTMNRAEAQAPSRLRIAMLVHPDMVLLDLVGPQTVFALLMGEVHLVGKTLAPVTTDIGIKIQPTMDFGGCPRELDVLFVPGGLQGTIAVMNDDESLAFLAERGRRARYVTSVCTGGLALGAAGLLDGYRATAHWYGRHLLPILGAVEATGRVVEDRNRITGGGVTAGVDFGLHRAARLRGDDYARRIQLVLEYDPSPPFRAGSPERAGQAAVDDIRQRRALLISAAETAARQAAVRMRERRPAS